MIQRSLWKRPALQTSEAVLLPALPRMKAAEPVYSDGGDTICVMDQVRDSKNTDESWLEQIALKEAIARLNDREKHILNLRFFEGKTQMEVSTEVGISQAQVSRLEKNAINQIKKNL